jgi:hypothetical protein
MDGIAVGGVLDVGPVGMMSPQSLALDDERSVVVFPNPDDGVIWLDYRSQPRYWLYETARALIANGRTTHTGNPASLCPAPDRADEPGCSAQSRAPRLASPRRPLERGDLRQ